MTSLPPLLYVTFTIFFLGVTSYSTEVAYLPEAYLIYVKINGITTPHIKASTSDTIINMFEGLAVSRYDNGNTMMSPLIMREFLAEWLSGSNDDGLGQIVGFFINVIFNMMDTNNDDFIQLSEINAFRKSLLLQEIGKLKDMEKDYCSSDWDSYRDCTNVKYYTDYVNKHRSFLFGFYV